MVLGVSEHLTDKPGTLTNVFVHNGTRDDFQEMARMVEDRECDEDRVYKELRSGEDWFMR